MVIVSSTAAVDVVSTNWNVVGNKPRLRKIEDADGDGSAARAQRGGRQGVWEGDRIETKTWCASMNEWIGIG